MLNYFQARPEPLTNIEHLRNNFAVIITKTLCLYSRGRIEKALSLAVDLSCWDLFCDARWAASRRALPALATEAASLALHYADLDHG